MKTFRQRAKLIGTTVGMMKGASLKGEKRKKGLGAVVHPVAGASLEFYWRQQFAALERCGKSTVNCYHQYASLLSLPSLVEFFPAPLVAHMPPLPSPYMVCCHSPTQVPGAGSVRVLQRQTFHCATAADHQWGSRYGACIRCFIPYLYK
jgi:hypothetical protein